MVHKTPVSASQGHRHRQDRGASAEQLIVVSNRQPYRHTETGTGTEVDKPTGGLTAGLDPAMQELGGTWIAWGDGDADREAVDDHDRVDVPPDEAAYTLRRVWLSETDVDQYYYGYSNQVLWPLCHSLPRTVSYETEYWQRYHDVNQQFADACVAEAGVRPTVWFQDYHLALAPEMVRSRLGDGATLMHFWHIPWPSWDVFRVVPQAGTVLRGLLGNDRIGFHVPRYRRNFMRCVEACVKAATVDWQADTITYQGRTVRVEAVPMGVPVADIQRTTASPTALSFPVRFRRRHDIDAGTTLALGVDRLDYTKGIPERLEALERLFETEPDWRGTVTYVQNASLSRSKIPAYQDLQERVTEAVERINDRFGTDEWRPVVATTDRLSRPELLGLYREADLAVVSPLRDGLNLVALEYVAAQTGPPGVLVLSQTAGIHDLLGGPAVSVNPLDSTAFSTALDFALRMPTEQRRRRMEALERTVSENDLSTWIDSYLERPQPPERAYARQ